jgi:predicted metal-dependent HD superfamily phosphohydrolase
MINEIRTKHWTSLKERHRAGAWEVLDAGYGDRHRAYHSWKHIVDLLEKLNELSHLVVRRDIITTAIFWHDVVYLTRNTDGGQRPDRENVSDSAELFRRYSLFKESDAVAVYEMIMATADHIHAEAKQQHYAGFVADLDLFLDLDLSPLAAPWGKFAANFEKIRFEYSWVPEAEFYSGQLKMLEEYIIAGARLFRRPETTKKWLNFATANLTRCVNELRTRLARPVSGSANAVR